MADFGAVVSPEDISAGSIAQAKEQALALLDLESRGAGGFANMIFPIQ